MTSPPRDPSFLVQPGMVSVIVVTWNSSRFVDACMKGVLDQGDLVDHIVVVDNGSSDDTVQRLRRISSGVEIVEAGDNLGFCRANNLGFARSKAPYVLFLNPDTNLSAGFLAEAMRAFEEPSVGMVAGKLRRFDGRTIDSAGQALARSRQPVDRGYGEIDRGQYDRDEEVFAVCGAAALYRRRTLEDLALANGEVFDEQYFAFYEDLDLAWRARRLGWRCVYRYRAVGLHARGGTASSPAVRSRWRALLSRTPEIRFHIVKNRYLTILRNDRWLDFFRNLPWALPRDVAMLSILALTSPSVLMRLWRERACFRRALELRRRDAEVIGRPRLS